MHYFPVFLTGKKINALVIGGGEVAARKIELLLKTPARVSVMCAKAAAPVSALIEENQLRRLKFDYQAGHMAEFNLVIAATNNEVVNQQIAAEANTLGLLVNVVDQPELCSYITPAIIDRSPIIIALCSSGSSPILLRMLREQIEKMLPQRYGELANFSARFRDTIKKHFASLTDRRTFWEGALSGRIGQFVLNGESEQAEQALMQTLTQNESELQFGTFHIVHVGDGFADNLTLKAHRAMQFIDVVYYQADINTELLEYVRRDAEKVKMTEQIDESEIKALIKRGRNVLVLCANNQLIEAFTALSPIVVYSGR